MFDLNEEEQMIRDTARDYAQNTLMQRGVDYDKSGEFPRENFNELGDLGFMGVKVPDEYGGCGLGAFPLVLVIEELAYACAATAVTLAVHNSLIIGPILGKGTEEQKKKYLPGLASGKDIGAYCITEPDYGSDVANLKTSAVMQDGKWILNGTKSWISTGGEAGVCIVFARTENDVEKPSSGLSAFIVEPDFKGFTVGKKEDKMGLCASNTVQLIFEDMEVPEGNLLGERGKGFHLAMGFLDAGRVGIAAVSIGVARACLDESLKYTRERKQFGKFLHEFQAIQAKLANMAMELEAAKLLTYQAARLMDAGKPHTQEASMAKLFASEMCNRAAAENVQIHGGVGYTKEFPAERHLRDAKVFEIFEGTSEIQRIVIARQLLAK